MAKVRAHRKRSKKGKRFTVRRHTRAGKARAVARMTQMHPNLKKSEASHFFDMTMESIRNDVKKEGKVTIPKFGTFKLKKTKARKSRMGINPFTKQRVRFKAKKAGRKIKFFPNKSFKRGI